MTRAPAPFPLERLADIPERPEDFRLLERIPLTREPQSWPLELSPVVGDEQPMMLLDTETTGLSADDESIIELGMKDTELQPIVWRWPGCFICYPSPLQTCCQKQTGELC